MSDNKIEMQLKEAVCRMVPDKSEHVWEEEIEKASGDEWYLEGTQTKKTAVIKVSAVKYVAAACLIICVLAVYMMQFRVVSKVYIDGRQSIALEMNQKGQVVRLTAKDAEEQEALNSINLKNQDQGEIVKNVLDTMKETGSINQERPVILVSVEGKDEEYLCEYLSDVAKDHMDETIGEGIVCDQIVERSTEVKELEEKYDISPGKATLIRKLAQDDPDGDVEKWVLLSMDELLAKTEEEGVELKEYIECKDSSPEKSYREEVDSEEGGEKTEDYHLKKHTNTDADENGTDSEYNVEEVETENEENFQEWEKASESDDSSNTEDQTESTQPSKESPEKNGSSENGNGNTSMNGSAQNSDESGSNGYDDTQSESAE